MILVLVTVLRMSVESLKDMFWLFKDAISALVVL
jgi:hypothetical protein